MVDWNERIDDVKKYIDTDPYLIPFMIREWDIVEKAGLKDIAWLLSRSDSYVTKNDVKGLLEDLQEFVNESVE